MPIFSPDEIKTKVADLAKGARAAVENVKPEKLREKYVSILATDFLLLTELASGNKNPQTPAPV